MKKILISLLTLIGLVNANTTVGDNEIKIMKNIDEDSLLILNHASEREKMLEDNVKLTYHYSHYSHRSHYSHYSHRSHYSHYSSIY